MKDRKSNPPGPAIRILIWFCPAELAEGILHDFEEQYQESVKSIGQRRANLLFYWNVIRLCHPTILLRNKLTFINMNTKLIRNHLLVAARSMTRYKFYSVANTLGLSMSMAFILLVFLFVKKETGYDNFHQNGANIHRVAISVIKNESGEVKHRSAVTAVPLGKKLLEEVPAVVNATRYASHTVAMIRHNKPIKETVYFVDPDFLKIFSFPIVEGSDHALHIKNQMVISQEKAMQYFGHLNPIGKSVSFDINGEVSSFVIQAVIDGKPGSSSLAVDFLLPFETYSMVVSQDVITSYNYGILENYVLLKPGVAVGQVEKICTDAINFNPKDDSYEEVILQPLTDIHLENEIVGNATYTNPTKFLIMIGLAFLVLIVSVINFITLSTGHVLVRLKEMGLRKVLGAHKRMLRVHLVLEAFVLSLLASATGALLAWLLLPFFNQLADSQITFRPDWDMLLFITGISILIAFINGIIQSLAVVNFKIVNALREKVSPKTWSGLMNQILVVIQFTISIVLIIGTFIIRSQMQYVQHKDLGFEQNNLIQVSLGNVDEPESTKKLVERLKTELSNHSRISAVTASMNNATEPWTKLTFLQVDETEEKICYNLVDHDYLETMNIEMATGAFFNPEKGNQSSDIVVNEALVKHFGWDNPLEQHIPGKDFETTHRIIGVVKDFHYSSLHSKIAPLILTTNDQAMRDGIGGLTTYMWPPNLYQMYVRFTPGEIPPVIDHLSAVWKQANADAPFTYRFVDEVVAQKYREEKRWARIVNASSLFSIFIAWMGLIGLTRLAVQRRTKEIGIRKVLGSSIIGVTSLLSKQFILLVLMANLIAWPVSYWLANSWLTSFTYRVAINPLVFLLSGLTVIGFVTLSVGLQSLFAAKTDPARSLQYE